MLSFEMSYKLHVDVITKGKGKDGDKQTYLKEKVESYKNDNECYQIMDSMIKELKNRGFKVTRMNDIYRCKNEETGAILSIYVTEHIG